MLHYYHSNRMESLLCAMENIIETPLRNPFHAEMIVVQNQGAAQWLRQQRSAID